MKKLGGFKTYWHNILKTFVDNTKMTQNQNLSPNTCSFHFWKAQRALLSRGSGGVLLQDIMKF